jgi:hypothetical protein
MHFSRLVYLVCFIGGCSIPQNASDPATVSGSGISLEILNAQRSSNFYWGSESHSDPDTLWVMVDFVLNNGSDSPAALDASRFFVDVDNGLLIKADEEVTLKHPSGCDLAASVGPKKSFRCTLVFVLQKDVSATALGYVDAGDDVAKTPFSETPCGWCESQCLGASEYASREDNCGVCGQAVGVGECVDGQVVCPDPQMVVCASGCVDLMSNEFNCGSCGNSKGGAVCENGKLQCAQEYLDCDGKCTPRNKSNCGGCGVVCDGSQYCTSAFDNPTWDVHCMEKQNVHYPWKSCDTLCESMTCDTDVYVYAETKKGRYPVAGYSCDGIKGWYLEYLDCSAEVPLTTNYQGKACELEWFQCACR